MTSQEANKVISELFRLQRDQERSTPSTATSSNKRIESGAEHRPGMITPKQVKKVWYFMYKLAEFDTECSKVSLGTRLCKVIEKHLGISAIEKDPFRFMTFDQGSTLIEVVKKLGQYEKRKLQKVKEA